MHTSDSDQGAEFCEVIRVLTAAYDRLGHAYAERHGVYTTDFRALLLVDQRQSAKEPITAGELAHQLGLSSGAVTYLVERLTQAGHLRREVDPSDRRKVLLACTQRGHDLAMGFANPVLSAVERSMSDLDDDCAARLGNALARMGFELDAESRRVAAEAPLR